MGERKWTKAQNTNFIVSLSAIYKVTSPPTLQNSWKTLEGLCIGKHFINCKELFREKKSQLEGSTSEHPSRGDTRERGQVNPQNGTVGIKHVESELVEFLEPESATSL